MGECYSLTMGQYGASHLGLAIRDESEMYQSAARRVRGADGIEPLGVEVGRGAFVESAHAG
jgi:hypothetical protein